MSSYLYKNMLIIERGTTNKVVLSLIKITYNIWFDVKPNDRCNEYPWDKIILFYNPELYTSNSDTFTEVDSNWMPPTNTPLGFIHLLSYNKILRVTNCKFPNHNDFSQEMRTFWQYIAESFRVDGIGNIDAYGVFIIYWDKDMVAPFANIVRDAGLMTNFIDCSHTFRDIEIRIAAASALSKSVIKSIYNTSIIQKVLTNVPFESSSSIFGDVPNVVPPENTVVRVAPTTTPTLNTMFGTAPTTTPTLNTMFGTAPTTTPNVSAMFGATPTTTPNVTTTPTLNTMFGAAPTTTKNSISTMFGSTFRTVPTASSFSSGYF
jgi:hypothetical protein